MTNKVISNSRYPRDPDAVRCACGAQDDGHCIWRRCYVCEAVACPECVRRCECGRFVCGDHYRIADCLVQCFTCRAEQLIAEAVADVLAVEQLAPEAA